MNTDRKCTQANEIIVDGKLLQILTKNDSEQIVGGGWSSYLANLFNSATTFQSTSTYSYSSQHQPAMNSIQNIR